MASVTPTRRSAPRAAAGTRSTGKLLPVSTQPPPVTLQDLLDQLGGIAPERVRLHPVPGTARQKDLLQTRRPGHSPVRYELVDGVLVQKVDMGAHEARLATILVGYLFQYLLENNIGAVNSGGDAYMKLGTDLIRVPDVMVIRWEAMPGRKMPKTPCPDLIADLVVEVLSKGNTKREIERKQQDFFAHGSRLFWVVDPRKQTVTVHRADGTRQVLGADDNVSGEQVLPGFHLSIREWFQVAEDGTRPGQKQK